MPPRLPTAKVHGDALLMRRLHIPAWLHLRVVDIASSAFESLQGAADHTIGIMKLSSARVSSFLSNCNV